MSDSDKDLAVKTRSMCKHNARSTREQEEDPHGYHSPAKITFDSPGHPELFDRIPGTIDGFSRRIEA